jgi:hypothetical protein
MILYMLRDKYRRETNDGVYWNAHGRATYTTLQNARKYRDKANAYWSRSERVRCEYEIVQLEVDDLEVVE